MKVDTIIKTINNGIIMCYMCDRIIPLSGETNSRDNEISELSN